MAKIKLTKTELKAQTDALKRFQRFLPMLQLKKQQLQGEIAAIVSQAEAVATREENVRRSLEPWVGLFATGEDLLSGLVTVKEIKTSTANIAGVEIPVFDGIDTEVRPVDLWATPAWVDDAVAAMTDMLALQSDVKVLAVKDYIRCPKDNGYRSYHMIVEVPVFFADRMRPIRVEVQIRTIAMDFWASLEHQLRYKKHLEIEDANALENELKECAETIAETDWRMLDLRQKIEEKGIIEKLDSWRNP